MQFFSIFSIFMTRSRTPKIFEYQFFKNFKKKIQKMTFIGPSNTARWGQINYKKKVHPKFLQNLLFHIPIDMFYGKKKFSAIESATVNFF